MKAFLFIPILLEPLLARVRNSTSPPTCFSASLDQAAKASFETGYTTVTTTAESTSTIVLTVTKLVTTINTAGSETVVTEVVFYGDISPTTSTSTSETTVTTTSASPTTTAIVAETEVMFTPKPTPTGPAFSPGGHDKATSGSLFRISEPTAWTLIANFSLSLALLTGLL